MLYLNTSKETAVEETAQHIHTHTCTLHMHVHTQHTNTKIAREQEAMCNRQYRAQIEMLK